MTALSSALWFTRDPFLPQREVLLNADIMEARIGAHPAVQQYGKITHCERRRTKYRIGESLRVLYRVCSREGESLVSARAFAAGKSTEAYERAVATLPTCRTASPIFHDAELETIFWLFPHDRKLPSLPTLSSVPQRLAHSMNMPWVNSRVVAYAPEKSATVQCLGTSGETLAYAKMYAGGDGVPSVRNHCALYHSLSPEEPYLRLPRILGYVAPYHLLCIESQDGQRIIDLRGAALSRGITRLGTAVARFHQLPAPPEVSRFTRLDFDHLIQAASLVSQARPDTAEHAATLVNLLSQRWQSPTTAPVCLHGDVHAKNGIVQDDRIALIDLDQVALGPAAAELGSFLASLHYWCCIGLLSSATRDELEAAFLEGYAMVSPVPECHTIRWYTAAALLAERALRAVNRVREQGLLHLGEILVTAQKLLVEKERV